MSRKDWRRGTNGPIERSGYLAVVLDAWSRRVVGYALGRTIEARLTVAALPRGSPRPRRHRRA